MTSIRLLLAISGILLKFYDVNGERDINHEHKPYYKTNAAAIVYFSVPTKELAEKLSRALVSEKLVACVNLLPDITAVFPNSKNEIKAEVQTMLIAKSATSRIQEVVEFIKKHHPDSMPDIVATPIRTGNGLFLEWVLSVVPPHVKKCLLANSTKTKRTAKAKSKIGITLPNGDAGQNAGANPEEEPPLPPPKVDAKETDVNYGSEDSEGNDPNEEHANSYP